MAGDGPRALEPARRPLVNAYRAEFGRLDLKTPREQLGFQELLSQAAVRTTGRQQRLAEDTASVPTPLWLALVFAGCIAIALQLSMADPRERVQVQGVLVAGFASVVVAGLLIVNFLRSPLSAPHRGNRAERDESDAGDDQRPRSGLAPPMQPERGAGLSPAAPTT